jgi:hypothetical protein
LSPPIVAIALIAVMLAGIGVFCLVEGRLYHGGLLGVAYCAFGGRVIYFGLAKLRTK